MSRTSKSILNIITAILLCFFILLQAIFAKVKESKKA